MRASSLTSWGDGIMHSLRESGTHFSPLLPGARTCPSVSDASEETVSLIDGQYGDLEDDLYGQISFNTLSMTRYSCFWLEPWVISK